MTALPSQEVLLDASMPWRNLRPAWLYQSLLEGSFNDGRTARRAEVTHLGALSVPSGQVVACDPFVFASSVLPFQQQVFAGVHEAHAARVWIGPGHERQVALLLVASSDPVVSWEMALVGEQDVSELEGTEYFGYGVDAGTGSLFAAEFLPALVEMMEEGSTEEDALVEALEREDPTLLDLDGHAVLACTSGWGDGSYPTWLGRSASGDVNVVMTDFLVIQDDYSGVEA